MSKVAIPTALPFDAGPGPLTVARPSNLARSGFHVAAAALSLLLLRTVPSRTWLIAIAGSLALWAWSMEIGRRFSPSLNAKLVRAFSPIAHVHERHQTNSSTWYVTALTLLATFAPLPAAELGVLVLGVADPAAGELGRRFGRTRLRAGRSLEGSLGFLAVGTLASLLWLTTSGWATTPALLLAAIASAGGALAELGSTRRFDDNFTIPLVVAGTATLVLAQIGG